MWFFFRKRDLFWELVRTMFNRKEKKPSMTHEQAMATLRWHAENSTQGNLADSCKHDSEWETAYRTIFGSAPTYAELMRKIESKR
jgi:hypothetical protein